MSASATKTSLHADLKALIRLSNFEKGVTPSRIEKLVQKSPDPETVVQAFLEEMPVESDVLRRKWRKTIQALWGERHPNLKSLPNIPITKQSSSNTYALLDALGVLSALSDAPGKLQRHNHHNVLSGTDSRRLAYARESSLGVNLGNIRTESDVPGLSRLLACLEAARLIRPVRGELQVVRSRLRRFLDLPRSYQFYVLWHCDVYHVNWSDFTERWQDCLRDIQDYLPLLWDVSEAVTPDEPIDKRDWCLAVSESFAPLWQSHLRRGLLQAISSVSFLVHQTSLAATINNMIINDLFARYGLIQFERNGNFVWTPLGINLLSAEINQTLPCGLELLH